MPSGRQYLINALTDFTQSLAAGLGASAQYPGKRGERAGMAAALAAPFQMAQVRRQQQMEEEDRKQRAQQIKDAMLSGNFDKIMQIARMRQGETAQENVVPGVGPLPVGTGAPQTNVLPIPPMQAELPGGGTANIPIESAQDQQAMKLRDPQYLLSLQREKRLQDTSKIADAMKGVGAGYRPKFDESGQFIGVEPIPESELSEPAKQKMKDSANLQAYREAQTEAATARAALARAQADPNSPQNAMLRERVRIADENLAMRAKGLALSEERMDNQPIASGAADVLTGIDMSLSQLNKIIPQIHQIAGSFGPMVGRVKLAELEKLGGMGLSKPEIEAALNMRRLLMSEAFANGGKQLTITERAEFEALLPHLSDTVDTALIKADQALEFLKDKKLARTKYLTPRQQKRMGNGGTPPAKEEGVVELERGPDGKLRPKP